MIVCHCNAVNDEQMRTAISCGAHNLDDIAGACRAGGNCAGCHERLEELLSSTGAHHDAGLGLKLPA